MAEAVFNAEAARRGLPVRATSAGTIAGATVNPTAIQAIAELGLDMRDARPKQLTQDMVAEARRIVTMGCGVDAAACPARFMVTEDWGLDDPAGQSLEVVRRIRDQVALRVSRLLDELEGKE
jgi:protein-tyrosine-phosphatase